MPEGNAVKPRSLRGRRADSGSSPRAPRSPEDLRAAGPPQEPCRHSCVGPVAQAGSSRLCSPREQLTGAKSLPSQPCHRPRGGRKDPVLRGCPSPAFPPGLGKGRLDGARQAGTA